MAIDFSSRVPKIPEWSSGECPPLRRTKSAAAEDFQGKCQNGYRSAEGTSDTSLIPRGISILTIQRCFLFNYRNCRSPSKNSIRRWCEQLRNESFSDSFIFV
ncbi:hypothetical protein AVEN_249711-1 [Araneus ventricosus]|uniref:DUF4817 domain-containing protein n=1 Tax=Araneus ventricosus TaxID=182803 RepID=A0A4Y2R3N3_ARAVE|nr:hypothetical protein AVEN_249711-1 [Araneus ventricosus]